MFTLLFFQSFIQNICLLCHWAIFSELQEVIWLIFLACLFEHLYFLVISHFLLTFNLVESLAFLWLWLIRLTVQVVIYLTETKATIEVSMF